MANHIIEAESAAVHADINAIERFILDHEISDDVWLSGVALVVLCVFLGLCLCCGRWRRWIFRHLKWIAGSVFVLGVVLYMIGFNIEGCRNNLLVLFLRSTVSSLEMFVSESELIEVSPHLKESHLYMVIFSLVHFLAVFISAIFVIRLFGLRLLSMLRLWFSSRFCHKSDLYVFWGINDIAMTVAESLAANLGRRTGRAGLSDKGRKTLLVFVNLPHEAHHHSARFTFSHFFHTADDGIEEYMERIEKLNHGTMRTFVTVAGRQIDMELAEACKERSLFGAIRLKNLERCLRNSDKVEFFFMSDDEQKNVEMVSVMMKSAPLSGKDIRKEAFNIYCYARENRINKSIAGHGHDGCNIYLVDSALLTVLQLKNNGANQPVNFVTHDVATGTVSSVFTALIIGFGETGRDVLKFLYEFSSFVKETRRGDDGIDDVVAQDRKIYVADGKLDMLKTKFLVDTPALADNVAIEWLDGFSTRDMGFWDRMRQIIDGLNYVVIAVDNDKEAASIALQMFDFAHRYRKDLSLFRIYVRLRDKCNGQLLGEVGQFRIKTDGREAQVIKTFGTKEEIFLYTNISEVCKEEEVARFVRNYNQIYDEISKDLPQDAHREELDSVDRDFKADYQQAQNRSNVSHIYTKLALAGVVGDGQKMDTARLERLMAETRRDANNEYSNFESEADRALFNNLSYCEHLRWNARTELSGFVHGDRKSMRRGTHDCLLTTNGLLRSESLYIRNSLKYDQGIVELSFRMNIGKEESPMD